MTKLFLFAVLLAASRRSGPKYVVMASSRSLTIGGQVISAGVAVFIPMSSTGYGQPVSVLPLEIRSNRYSIIHSFNDSLTCLMVRQRLDEALLGRRKEESR